SPQALAEALRQRRALLERAQRGPERRLDPSVLRGEEALHCVAVSDAATVDELALLLVLPDPALTVGAAQARRVARLRIAAGAAPSSIPESTTPATPRRWACAAVRKSGSIAGR